MVARAVKIINNTIQKLQVDLSGKIVLTEVGSNNYQFTPTIATLCGAKKVFAVAKDSKYGLAKDIIKDAKIICKSLRIDNIEFLENQLPEEVISQCDIITNSGSLRPLNKEKLQFTKKGVVIPLMYEAWEIRDEDIDIQYCKKKGIAVAGTWENHPDIKVFDYCGTLAMKMAFDAGYEVTGNKIIVWTDDHFGEVIQGKFLLEGADVICTVDINVFYNEISTTDFVFISDYDEKRNYFGKDSVFDSNKIKAKNRDVTFIHLFGKIDIDYCNSNGINISPNRNGLPSVMTNTLGYVGLNPILKLQVAGFKVAQELLEENYSDLSQIII